MKLSISHLYQGTRLGGGVHTYGADMSVLIRKQVWVCGIWCIGHADRIKSDVSVALSTGLSHIFLLLHKRKRVMLL